MKLTSEEPAAHWYAPDGSPAHGSDLRVARKRGLLPSVTSVLQVKAKPALDKWRIEQAILAALTLPRLEGESDQDFAARVVIDMDSQRSRAASVGSAIHKYAETITSVGPRDIAPIPPGYEVVCAGLQEWINQHLGIGAAEHTMVNLAHGYAGRIDWVGELDSGQPAIVDFKTQNVKPSTKPTFYPEHCYQLSAYAGGQKNVALINVIIGTHPDNPIIEAKRWTQEEAETGWEIFLSLLRVWKLERGYDPLAVINAA